jgi:hypothetical protein
MSTKLQRIEEHKNVYLPFSFGKFLAYLSVAFIVSALSLAALLKLPQIGLTGILFLVVVYFLPSFIAYDVTSSYNETHNIPKLLHPKRGMILILNILLGITGIGWLVALALAISPGAVNVTSVRFVKV